MIKLEKLTIKDILQNLEKKEFSCSDIVKSYINRIEEIDKYNLVSEKVFEEALLLAKKSDNKKKEDRLPLEGIPIAVKDIFCTKGHHTTASSNILKSFVSPYESTVTNNLKKAGAIIVCKTNMDEFAMGSASDTCNLGDVINPWTTDLKKPLTPGGSSGGSAGIIAASGACFSLGTDTGGSIRQPASFCGVVGLKPSYGRCSRFGIISFASSLDQAGPITKNVEDAAYALSYMASYDNKDSTSYKENMQDLLVNLKKGVKGLKIGIPKEYNIKGISTEIKNLWEQGKKILQEQGAEIVEISLPHSEFALPTYYIIAPAEASANLARYDGVKYGHRSKSDFKNLDDMYCKTRGEGFGKEVKRRLLIGTYVLSSGYYDAYYIKAQKVRQLIKNDFDKSFKQVDAILTPSTPSAAFKIGEKKDDPISMYLNDIFTVPVNLAGIPAISIPAGVDNNNYPLGLQLIGKPLDEQKLLNIAFATEKKINFKQNLNRWWEK
jgi:aspartyl-tRNA(Asn)/glutamyl-tRNA(Gln) amidotransferase subunit A